MAAIAETVQGRISPGRTGKTEKHAGNRVVDRRTSRFEERLRRLAVTAVPQLNQARLGNAMLVRFWTSGSLPDQD